MRVDLDVAQSVMYSRDPPEKFSQQQQSNSIFALSQAAMSGTDNAAILETQEDLGFALGGRLRTMRRTSQEENSRTRVLTQKMLVEIEMIEPVELQSLLDEPNEWSNASDLVAALRQRFSDPGQAALRLAAYLRNGNLDKLKRRRFEQALGSFISKEDDLSVALFGALEFGKMTPLLRQDIKRLYHQASEQRPKLSQWLSQLGDPESRRKKLCAMLRVLAYELSASAQPIMGSHLVAVIGDLQRLLLILSVDGFCYQNANGMSIPGLDGDTLLRSTVELVEQIWVDIHTLSDVLPKVDETHRYILVQSYISLMQLLPDACFIDSESKTQIGTALLELRESIADE